MSAVDLVAKNKVPVSPRDVRKDKAQAADAVANHALGIFNDAVEQLSIANALLDESIEEETEELLSLQERIEIQRQNREANSRVLAKINDLLY